MLLAACGRAPSERPHGLFRALMDGGDVVIGTPEGPLGDAGSRAARRLEQLGLKIAVSSADPAGLQPIDAARVLVFRVDDSRVTVFLGDLGVERLERPAGGRAAPDSAVLGAASAAGFSYLGRDYPRPDDWARFVIPDPDRPGLPLVLSIGNDEERLARAARAFELGWFPGFECYRAGELERRGRLVAPEDGAGTAYTGRVETDLIDAWAQESAARSVLVRRGLTFSVPRAISIERAMGFVDRAGVALGRGRALAGDRADVAEDGAPRTSIVGYLHADAGRMGDLTGRAQLAFANPQATLVHVLVDPQLPDDGGAALVAAELEQILGPPGHPWIARATGTMAARAFWGRPLRVWGAWLVQAGLGTTAAELLDGVADPLQSPLCIEPLRALLLEFALARGGTADFVALWRGNRHIDPDANFEREWSLFLDGLLDPHRDDFLALRERRAVQLKARGSLSGARCEIADDARWFGAAAEEGLATLAAMGASSAMVGVVAWPPDPAAALPGTAQGPIAMRGDLEILAAVGAARRAGLAAILAPELLETEHGHLMADTIRTSVHEWQRAFERLGHFAVHYALLAELAGADVFVLGIELPKATRNAPDPRLREGVPELRRAAWNQLIARVRGATGAALTYAAGSGDEPDWVEFWELLDYVGLMAFSPLVPPFARSETPTHGELVGALAAQFGQIGAVAARAGKPALVLGVGYPATAAAWPNPWVRAGATDALAQELFYRALATAWSAAARRSSALFGVVFWTWRADQRATSARDFAVDGRPAQRHLPTLFERP